MSFLFSSSKKTDQSHGGDYHEMQSDGSDDDDELAAIVAITSNDMTAAAPDSSNELPANITDDDDDNDGSDDDDQIMTDDGLTLQETPSGGVVGSFANLVSHQEADDSYLTSSSSSGSESSDDDDEDDRQGAAQLQLDDDGSCCHSNLISPTVTNDYLARMAGSFDSHDTTNSDPVTAPPHLFSKDDDDDYDYYDRSTHDEIISERDVEDVLAGIKTKTVVADSKSDDKNTAAAAAVTKGLTATQESALSPVETLDANSSSNSSSNRHGTSKLVSTDDVDDNGVLREDETMGINDHDDGDDDATVIFSNRGPQLRTGASDGNNNNVEPMIPCSINHHEGDIEQQQQQQQQQQPEAAFAGTKATMPPVSNDERRYRWCFILIFALALLLLAMIGVAIYAGVALRSTTNKNNNSPTVTANSAAPSPFLIIDMPMYLPTPAPTRPLPQQPPSSVMIPSADRTLEPTTTTTSSPSLEEATLPTLVPTLAAPTTQPTIVTAAPTLLPTLLATTTEPSVSPTITIQPSASPTTECVDTNFIFDIDGEKRNCRWLADQSVAFQLIYCQPIFGLVSEFCPVTCNYCEKRRSNNNNK